MEEPANKRVLVVSNNHFSFSDANGRTLGELFVTFNPNDLFQFFINSKPLDMIDCTYIQLSDAAMIESFFSFKLKERFLKKGDYCNQDRQKKSKKRANNPLLWLIRDFLWSLTIILKKNAIFKMSRAIKPTAVVLQAGDSCFMNKIAKLIAKFSHANLIIFNTEDYCFKRWNYLSANFGFLWPLVHKIQFQSMKKTISYSSFCIYNSAQLQRAYQAAFPLQKSAILYTSTDWIPCPTKRRGIRLTMTYFGNFAGQRYKSLINIQKIIRKNDLPIDVVTYGSTQNEEEEKAMLSVGIQVKGFTPYSTLRAIAEQSDILLHIESFDSFIARDRVNGFSTKIADCLASGRCFLVYAPKNMAFCQYLVENNAAFVCANDEELEDALLKICKSTEMSTRFISNAIRLAKENHSPEKNSQLFQKLIYENHLS